MNVWLLFNGSYTNLSSVSVYSHNTRKQGLDDTIFKVTQSFIFHYTTLACASKKKNIFFMQFLNVSAKRQLLKGSVHISCSCWRALSTDLNLKPPLPFPVLMNVFSVHEWYMFQWKSQKKRNTKNNTSKTEIVVPAGHCFCMHYTVSLYFL